MMETPVAVKRQRSKKAKTEVSITILIILSYYFVVNYDDHTMAPFLLIYHDHAKGPLVVYMRQIKCKYELEAVNLIILHYLIVSYLIMH